MYARKPGFGAVLAGDALCPRVPGDPIPAGGFARYALARDGTALPFGATRANASPGEYSLGGIIDLLVESFEAAINAQATLDFVVPE